ncbi:transposase, Ptta/En/Spm [Tanacetum coccineum]
MISTEAENEQQHNEAQSQSNGHSANETNDANSSQMDTTTNEHSDNQNELGGPPKKYGKPVGVEGNELTQFLGSVVRIAGNVGLHCEDWRKVDKEKKEDMYSIVKEKFAFHPAETSAIKKWVLSSMGKKLNTWRNLVKSRNYDPALSVEEIMERQTDSRVNPEQFQVLVNRWMKPEYQAICEQKRISRSKMEEPHITGTKSFARLAEEEATKNNGVHPTRRNMLLLCRHPYKLLQMTLLIPKISDNFSSGQNNSTNGNQGNLNQGSFVSDQNIGTLPRHALKILEGVKRLKVITMLAAFDEVTIRW